jgi:hypothetical protein
MLVRRLPDIDGAEHSAAPVIVDFGCTLRKILDTHQPICGIGAPVCSRAQKILQEPFSAWLLKLGKERFLAKLAQIGASLLEGHFLFSKGRNDE